LLPRIVATREGGANESLRASFQKYSKRMPRHGMQQLPWLHDPVERSERAHLDGLRAQQDVFRAERRQCRTPAAQIRSRSASSVLA
jgi:hypothetical protein